MSSWFLFLAFKWFATTHTHFQFKWNLSTTWKQYGWNTLGHFLSSFQDCDGCWICPPTNSQHERGHSTCIPVKQHTCREVLYMWKTYPQWQKKRIFFRRTYLAERSSLKCGLRTTLSHISFRIRWALAFLSLDSTTGDSFEGPAYKEKTEIQVKLLWIQSKVISGYYSDVYLVLLKCLGPGWYQWRQWWVTPQQVLK